MIYLTARDEARGQATLKELESTIKSKSKLAFHALDISDENSVDRFGNFLKREHEGGLAAVINNAGIATKGSAFDSKIVKETLQTNYYGTRK